MAKILFPADIAGESEHSQQAALFTWANYATARYPALQWMHAIPNGGLRNKATAAKLAAEGVKAGVADVFLPKASGGYHGLYIEMKRPSLRNAKKSPLSVKQDAFKTHVMQEGYLVVTCFDWIEARDMLIFYLG